MPPAAHRFSDAELIEFHEEFKQHLEKYDERVKTDDARYEALFKLQRQNAKSVKTLIEETRDIVRIHRDLQGVARVGMGMQKFMAFCLKFGFIGVSLAAIVGWIIQYFDKLGGSA